MKSSELPLLNKRIVVTRAEEQSENIISGLERNGATVIPVPTIKILPAKLSAEDESHIRSFYDYDVAIFPSANGARIFFTKIADSNRSLDVKHKPFIIAIGRKTAEVILTFGFAADFVPGKFNSEELMKSLANFDWKSKRVLIPCGNLSNNELADFVKSHGATADQVIVYNTEPNDSIDEKTKSEIRNLKFDIVTFYSPSQVKNFVSIFGADVLKEKRIAVIGPTTKKAVEHHGLTVAIIPGNSTTEDLITCLCQSGFAQAGEHY